jgi:hypothetical protein
MLKGLFRHVALDGDSTFMPFVRTSIIVGGNTSLEVDGLIDSGSSLNLISISSSKTLLGESPDEVRKGRKMPVAGFGAATSFAYGWQVNLRLRATTNATEYFLWPDVWIYASEMPLPIGQILIGQSKGLEERVFVHLNRQRKRYWLITA